ncbi:MULTISPECIES: carbohydrate ABC transporter permease [Rhizobium]|uniref:Raffinose/stachyose/melibiose transport system permease protein n=1 Tax=Rhizobium tropici TaxID=398 RepID=A0A6P1C7N2_RHITR|nr:MULTISPECIES: sugar ABC transporter permease [Rhizobium]AGB75023.1 putative amino acid ABC transporter, permease protein [Rhizobium tropici CIAT 899]MBB4243033.1 raffinose/stachyose/melibiose transport system permease protein [Rhizobium tropici]MBB5594552.1 raffinose/stachyose/melibiose transport system permease protein [Rhizobium tropici]MBB6493359.1 raffinose/stachyose/melibiose transport system permease protein [Rhizobium tropici]NEV11563.1 sugar ABC transporter permease [Rhizobium tropi
MKRSPLDANASRNLIYILPGLLVYLALVLGPIIAAIGISFTEWNGIGSPNWVGFGNYAKLLSDETFYVALKNNALFMVFYCVIPIVVGLLLAALVWSLRQREQFALRTLLFLPYIMPTAVLGIIWHWLYNPAFGPINQALKLVGLGSIALPWLGDFTFVLPAVGIVASWYFFGFCMVLFLSGIQRIDPSLFEAARVDGASGSRIFFFITLPLLLPEIRIALLLTIIASIKSFDLIFTMTRGGPANATLVPNIYMYELGFQLNRYGYASAVAIIGAILVFTINYAVHRLVRPVNGGSAS